MSTEPQTLTEAIRYFADPDVALTTMVELRWPEGVHCPICGRADVRFIATRRVWECKEKHPRRQFSAKVGTIFEDSPLGLDKWFAAVWMIANCKNGVSSYEIHRAIGVTQKSAWFMLHRIRLAMQTGSFLKSGGGSEFEADESFFGGRAVNMHKMQREKLGKGRGTIGKAVVMGILRRGDDTGHSKVVAKSISDTSKDVLHAEVKAAVPCGKDRLIEPIIASTQYLVRVPSVAEHTIEAVAPRASTPPSAGRDALSEPLIQRLLARLPPLGSEWPHAKRVQWLQVLASNMEMIYAAQKEEENRNNRITITLDVA